MCLLILLGGLVSSCSPKLFSGSVDGTLQASITGAVSFSSSNGFRIKIYEIKEGGELSLLGETTSNAQGEFSFTFPEAPTGPVKLVATENNPSSTSPELSQVLAEASGEIKAPITPLTTMVAKRVLEKISSGEPLSKVSEFRDLAKTEVGKIWGVPGSVIEAVPNPAGALGNKSLAEAKATYLLAVFSKLAQNLGVSSGKTAELAELLAEDFSSDLRLDGKQGGAPFSRNIQNSSGATISARTLAEGWRYHMQKAAREVASTSPYVGFDSDVQFASTIADSAAPAVVSVSASSPAGLYTTGSSLYLEVKFSGKVFVTGTPQIKLNSGSSAFANYLAGNESDTLVFEYVVSSLETTSALDVESASALSLNSGTIQDIVGNDV
ncbi:hypothetical protein EBT16_14160, partial [bacterium]|nr:hypothetical protein [bacterium]